VTQFELEAGETETASWPAESVRTARAKGVPGWLVLTDRRVLFYRHGGLLRGRAPIFPPDVSVQLGQVRTVSAWQFRIRIGYGDQMPIPGVEVDGHRFILNRETPSSPVVAAITAARAKRGAPPAPTVPPATSGANES
jgi:hypothetical protein